jgi:hypothetical protein
VGETGRATRRPTDAERHEAASWRRERWATRYNAQWDALITQWSYFLAPDERTTRSAFGLAAGEGIDAIFALYPKTGWCPPGMRPSLNLRER